MDRIVALAPIWARAWHRRRAILTLAVSATIVVGVIAFILPPWYRAEVELLPSSEEESGVGLASLLRGVGVPGIKIPTQVTPADVFIVVLESRRVNEQMVTRFDLKKLYKTKFMVDAVRELRVEKRLNIPDEAPVLFARPEVHLCPRFLLWIVSRQIAVG